MYSTRRSISWSISPKKSTGTVLPDGKKKPKTKKKLRSPSKKTASTTLALTTAATKTTTKPDTSSSIKDKTQSTKTSTQPKHSHDDAATKIKLTPTKLTKRFSITQNVEPKGPKIVRRDIDDPHNILVRRRLGEGSKPLFHGRDHRDSTRNTVHSPERKNIERASQSHRSRSRSSTSSRSRSRSHYRTYKRQIRRSPSSSSSSCSSKSQSYRKGRKKSSRASSGDKYERVNRKTTASRKIRSRTPERNDKTKSSEKIPYFADSRREEERIARRRKLMDVMKKRQRERSRSRERPSQRRNNNTIPERRENRYRRRSSRSRSRELETLPYGYMQPHQVVYCPAPMPPQSQPMTLQYMPAQYFPIDHGWLGPGHRPVPPHAVTHGIPYHPQMPFPNFRPNFGFPPRQLQPPPYMMPPYRNNNVRHPRLPRRSNN